MPWKGLLAGRTERITVCYKWCCALPQAVLRTALAFAASALAVGPDSIQPDYANHSGLSPSRQLGINRTRITITDRQRKMP